MYDNKLYLFRSWIVVKFEILNEVQHVPSSWFLNKKTCWFSYMKSDGKYISFSTNQICKMISSCINHNDHDGSYYDASKTAGPFG